MVKRAIMDLPENNVAGGTSVRWVVGWGGRYASPPPPFHLPKINRGGEEKLKKK